MRDGLRADWICLDYINVLKLEMLMIPDSCFLLLLLAFFTLGRGT